MHISLDFFKQNNIHIDWGTLYVGYKLNLLKEEDISDYAVEFLTYHSETADTNIIQLAMHSSNMDFENLLKELSDLNLNSIACQIEVRKWRLSVLSLLKKAYQDEREELLGKISEAYANFNYPEDMDYFINYLTPLDGYNPSEYSKDENITRLINLFNEFLLKEQRYIVSRKH